MCGICGILDLNENGKIDKSALIKMCAQMKHRGPDDEGVYVSQTSPAAGLGHRRLSIIDLDETGHQPMCNEDGSVWIVFNGEIYNYSEIRKELESKGHKFKSSSDTETIIHLYESYGDECVFHLRGMFAFAIWDENRKALFMARDRLGKKPLLYYFSGGKFCFASEFSSILASGMVDKEVSAQAVHYYMTFGYVPAPLTIYKNVFKLPPAHILILKNGNITSKPYWHPDYSDKLKISEQEAQEELLKLLNEAVKIRLYSEVPLGAFLSGGIDSSVVVALMSRLAGNKVKTFSIGFEENDYSELRYAKAVADRYGTDHHEFIVKPNALEILPLLVERYGEPYADSSAIPTYYVSQQTRKFVTVALNGDGGDEAFAGYDRYQAMLLAGIYKKFPPLIKESIRGLNAVLSDPLKEKNRLSRLKRFLEFADLSDEKRYLKWVGILGKVSYSDIYSPEFFKRIRPEAPEEFIGQYLSGANNLNILDRVLMADTYTYLPNDLLVKIDIASMANSLEARSPLLDHKLIEFAARLPYKYKMKKFIKKYILKESAKGLIPQENITRSKMGFAVPMGKWLRGEMSSHLRDCLLSERALKRRYFNPSTVKCLVEDHISGRYDHSRILWALLMFELWHLKFLDA